MLKIDYEVREVNKEDYENLIEFFKLLNEEDKKFLAFDQKEKLIKQIIKKGNHCYIALINDNVIGFLRESGRPNNFSLLEEIFVSKDYRNKGIAKGLINHYHNIFSKTLAKTNTKNIAMIKLLEKFNYTKEKDLKRIIHWKRE